MAVEDLTTYTEQDTGTNLTVTATKVNVVGIDGFDDAYLYKDYTADFFNAIDALFETLCSNVGTNFPTEGGCGFSNVAGAYRATIGSTAPWASWTTSATFSLVRGSYAARDDYAASLSTIYYCRMERAAGSDTITLKIYSDSGRTTLLDTLSIAGLGTATKYRYAYAFVHHASDESNTEFTGYLENIDLGIAPATSIKTVNGLAKASVKTRNGLAIASVKTIQGLA